MPPTSTLGYALLGLLHQQPRSGYDLRKIFAETPMMSFSDSPGAIYPALRRLEERGLIRGRVEPSAAVRRRKVFRLTPRGLAQLRKWLAQPVSRDDVVSRMGELMLRFGFMSQVAGTSELICLLEAIEAELGPYLASLKEYLASQTGRMHDSGRLALEGGIAGYEAQLRWLRRAATTLKQRSYGGAS